MRKILTICFVIVSAGAPAQYFYDKLYSFSLDMNQPVSNTDFLDTFSSSGARFAFNSFITEHFTAGLDVNWNKYVQQDPRQTYYSANGAFTAEYHKYIVVYGLSVKVGYYLRPMEQFTPFFHLGLGASNVDYKVYYNIYSEGESAWGLLIRPEAGVLYRLGQHASWGVQVSLHGDWSGAKSDAFDYSGFSTMGISLGVVGLDW